MYVLHHYRIEQWKEMEQRTKQLEEREEWLSQKEASLNQRESDLSQQLSSLSSPSKTTTTTTAFGSIVGYYRLSLIERVTSQFDETKEIGKGGFGRVFKATIGTIDVVCSIVFLVALLL